MESVTLRGYDEKVPFAPLPRLVAGMQTHGPVQDEQGGLAGILVLGEGGAIAQGDDCLGQSGLRSAVEQMGAASAGCLVRRRQQLLCLLSYIARRHCRLLVSGILRWSHNERHGCENSRHDAELVAGRFGVGATLQLGIGGIPDAVLSALTGHGGLRVWSEMVRDGILNL
jgi:hypothetical protein